VEATSVTPFSARARDKGLEGVFTAAVRLGDPGLAAEKDAALFTPDNPWVKEVVDAIAARAAAVGEPGNEAEAQTREELVADMDRWSSIVRPDRLTYTRRGIGPRAKKDPDKRYLLDSQEDRRKSGVFVAPGSLREVETEVSVHLFGTHHAADGGTNSD
jgi:hypothetical protein